MARLKEWERCELAEQINKLWAENKPFLMQAEVGAPYDGCFHEPNIFLVTPIGCAQQEAMGDYWPGLGKGGPLPVVWPLYGSGQGIAMDAVRSLTDLHTVIDEESVYDLAMREDGMGTFLVTGIGRGTRSYGRITPHAVTPMGPLNERLPAGERYWMNALIGGDEWGLNLTWTCPECGEEQFYSSDPEDQPVVTGYRGDGGIGVHPEGVMCYHCFEAGECPVCRDAGSAPTESYDPEMVEHGWSLCRFCQERLVEGFLSGDVDDLPGTVCLNRKAGGGYCITDDDNILIREITIDESIGEQVTKMNLEFEGGGLRLSGVVVENEAWKGTD